ncbi:MAG: hypothetical protein HXY40_18720 [Chloroflexi bacterium]|nr:hypothetical protein [Chloroflexota bacterium]
MDNEKRSPEEQPEITAALPVEAENAVPSASAAVPETPQETESELDIDAALAAMASLEEAVAAQDRQEDDADDGAPLQTGEIAAVDTAQTPPAPPPPAHLFPTPPLATLPRGNIASVLPALLLIGIGAWLTFALTTTTTPPDAGLIAAVGLGGVGSTLLARWLALGRWARGTLFVISALLLSALTLAYLTLSGQTQNWPLFIAALGLAFWLAAQLGRPRDTRLMLPGTLLVGGGLVGVVFANVTLSADVLSLIGTLWFVPLLAVLLLWLLPLLRRRS